MEKFISESEAKAKWKKQVLKEGFFTKVFYIETEETEDGFPDVIAVRVEDDGTSNSFFLEFKVTDKRNRIKFQRTQPSWYIRNKELCTTVVVWHNKEQRFIYLPTNLVIERLNVNLELQL